MSDMKMEGEEIVRVALDPSEVPENLLEVYDDEITIEKYISEKEKKLMDEQQGLEEGNQAGLSLGYFSARLSNTVHHK